MEPEGTQNKSDLKELLHNKSKLQSLRTYQGDVADIIKNQNESVASIAIKEKERDLNLEPKQPTSNMSVSFVTLILTFLLIAGSAVALIFVFGGLQKDNAPDAPVGTGLIPHSNIISISNVTLESLPAELEKAASDGGGVVSLQISDVSGKEIEKTEDLLKFLKAHVPADLLRNLGKEYELGIYAVAGAPDAYFLALTTNDFGVAFSGMLDWESDLRSDLFFFDTRVQSSTTPSANFVWKDMIIKNKDVRALANVVNDDDVVIAYTFLDQNAILITNNLSALSELFSLYASRAVA